MHVQGGLLESHTNKVAACVCDFTNSKMILLNVMANKEYHYRRTFGYFVHALQFVY